MPSSIWRQISLIQLIILAYPFEKIFEKKIDISILDTYVISLIPGDLKFP